MIWFVWFWSVEAIFSPLIASADSCSFFFLSFSSSYAFFVLGLFICSFISFIKLRAYVCMGVRGCVHVCTGVRKFSEFLLENRVLISVDFNTYPIRIFSIISSMTTKLDQWSCIFGVYCKELTSTTSISIFASRVYNNS